MYRTKQVIADFHTWCANHEVPVHFDMMMGRLRGDVSPFVQIDGIHAYPPQQGHGTRALHQLCILADQHQVALELEIGGDETPFDVLCSWYHKHGFVWRTNRSCLRRDPKPPS